VLLTWENEAYLATKKLGEGKFEIVTPSQSILAEASVAVVDANVKKHGTEKLATEYLTYLYSPEGQKIAARNYYRPRDPAAAKEFKFTPVKLFTIDEVFGGWSKAQKTHFEDGGTFDQIYNPAG
jgi:sulfate transport system substrate-binding protein